MKFFFLGGEWKSSLERLEAQIRPCMKELLSAALESSLHVCIVTFSEQSKLIEDLVASAFTK